MKKIAVILAAGLCLAVMLAGCGKENTEEDTSKEDKASVSVEDYDAQEYVTLGEYLGMELSVEKSEVTEEDIRNYVEEVIKMYPPYEETDKTVIEDGDFVNIDYEGLLDGEAFTGGTAAGYVLEIGSHSFIDGFEDGLVGAKVGEKLALDLTFPDPYQNNPDLAGKAVVFNVTVNSIVQKVDMTYDTITDEYVSEQFGQETVEQFKEDVKSTLSGTTEYYAESNMRSLAISKLQEICTVKDLPKELLDQRVADYKQQVEESVTAQGTTLPEYLEQNDMTEEEFNDSVLEDMKANLEFEFILQAIAAKEKIELDEEGFQTFAANMTSNYGFESQEALFKEYGEDYVKQIYLGNKAIDFVLENAKVTYTTPTVDGAKEE